MRWLSVTYLGGYYSRSRPLVRAIEFFEQYKLSSNNITLHCYSRHIATTMFTFMDIIARPGWKVGLCKTCRVYVYMYSAYTTSSGYGYYFINFNVCLYCNCNIVIQCIVVIRICSTCILVRGDSLPLVIRRSNCQRHLACTCLGIRIYQFII